MCGLFVCATACIVAFSVLAPRAATGQLIAAELLAKVSVYLESYEKAFSVVVAEETYVQEIEIPPRFTPQGFRIDQPVQTERTLRSDMLETSVNQRDWVAFRDVFEVNGRAVRDHDARLQRLFIDTPTQALEQAKRIVAESARFNLGSLQRDINVPTMALTYLRGSNQSRSAFNIAGRKDIDGVSGIVLEFREQAHPTIIRSADADLAATGKFWVEPGAGRVLKSEVSVADRRSAAKITVTYGSAPKLTVWAPILMIEDYTGVEKIHAQATYSNFRQFTVTVK